MVHNQTRTPCTL